jgi:hypothetical protein
LYREEAELERSGTGRSSAISGRFVLSIANAPCAREVFGRFTLAEVETPYTVSAVNGAGKRVGELVVIGPE